MPNNKPLCQHQQAPYGRGRFGAPRTGCPDGGTPAAPAAHRALRARRRPPTACPSPAWHTRKSASRYIRNWPLPEPHKICRCGKHTPCCNTHSGLSKVPHVQVPHSRLHGAVLTGCQARQHYYPQHKRTSSSCSKSPPMHSSVTMYTWPASCAPHTPFSTVA